MAYLAKDRLFFYIQLSINGKSRYSHVQIHGIDKEVKLIKIFNRKTNY